MEGGTVGLPLATRHFPGSPGFLLAPLQESTMREGHPATIERDSSSIGSVTPY